MSQAVHKLLSALAALALFAMMLLTFADVISRKYLGNSITGAVELTELAMLVMIFSALPLASMAGEHIVFDLLDRVLPPWLQRWQQVLSNALTAAVFGGTAWVVWQRALRTSRQGDTTATLELSISPYQRYAAVLLALTAVAHLLLMWRAARKQVATQVPASTAAPKAESRP